MKKNLAKISAVLIAIAASPAALAQTPDVTPALVTVNNYNRAQTDVNFAGIAKSGGFGKFSHGRELSAPVQQGIVRPNRDTLYSFVLIDLDAGPARITTPDAGQRFMGMQVVDQDQYTFGTYYGAGTHTLTREKIGTRYAVAIVRFLVDFSDQDDVRQVHALQDAIQFSQKTAGTLDMPHWDEPSLKKVRTALQQLGSTLSDTRGMFGANAQQVNPVTHLIGSAMLWGGNPEKDALYLPITPAQNDGRTVYQLTVGEVPVDGFWSLTVYNSDGYLVPNSHQAYSLNSITAQAGADGNVSIQLGACDGGMPNCLPITDGWSYVVRMFRPRAEILDGTWVFPLAQPTPGLSSDAPLR
ncbi:DUF1254 domain-containing protein [Janthinobacterium agaricidamnosum]|uniref:Carboxylesterase n=1 Tax=Janthinobacterium agaricidamnosum NBRC 102515 = DSM 9628 TaxID=1349767 RepID=W0V4N9_9BURK|nr:DUF1254 domain-containing protein [Janthinobacterium agaricidamnosum]CDG83794.1 conserved hypothetical protein [Janthinobacterium agaricidamnosum NBRC 102515 = DSM 9628]